MGRSDVRYRIVDLSGSLRARQQQTLACLRRAGAMDRPAAAAARGVIVGNEVLDAMPVQLLQRRAGAWFERGVVLRGGAFAWEDRPTELRPPCEVEGEHDYLTEIHPQAEAFRARWPSAGRAARPS